MYLRAKGSADKSPEITIETCNLDGGQCTVVFSDRRLHSSNGFSDATWVADGRILFTLPEPPPNENDANIWAIEVDLNTGQIRGKPSRVTNWTGFSMDGFSHPAEGKRLMFMKTQQRSVVKITEIRAKDGKAESPRRLNEDSWNSLAGAWTIDSQNLFTVSNRSGKWGVYKQNLLEHDSHALIAGSGNYNGPAISPDGKWLFYSESTGLDYSDASTRLMRIPIEGGPASVVLRGRHRYSCSRSPANLCVVSELKGKDLIFSFLEPIKGLGRQIASVSITRDYYDLSLSPDGKSIALVAEQEKIIRIVSTGNGSVHSVSLKDWTWLHGPIVSPDGYHLAYDERDFVSSVTMLENF